MKLLPIVFVLFAAGCHRGPVITLKRAAPAKLEPGWQLIPRERFTIAVPEGWEKLDIDPKKGPSGSPFLGPGKSRGLMDLMPPAEGDDFLFVAGGDLMNLAAMTIASEDRGETMDLKAEGDEIEGRIRQMPSFTTVTRETMELPVGKAERIKAELTPSDNGLKAVLTHYVLVDGTVRYTAMFMGFTGATGAMPTKRIMRTFRVR